MRNISNLHPKLQEKIKELQKICKKNNIKIGIGECVRTVAEQDALYAKGRTAAGSIVTNCRGSSYNSMHQWGVAFDFYLIMDVDKDGKTSDDAYNNATKLFDKVGKIGQSIGLEWGGAWKSQIDKPHFQLPEWGSTALKLKKQYGTPEKFMDSWGKNVGKTDQSTKEENVTAAKNKAEAAKSKNKKYNRKYTTTANLNLRAGAGTGKDIITTIKKGGQVTCYGYYTKIGNAVWLFVQYGKHAGFVSKDYCR